MMRPSAPPQHRAPVNVYRCFPYLVNTEPLIIVNLPACARIKGIITAAIIEVVNYPVDRPRSVSADFDRQIHNVLTRQSSRIVTSKYVVAALALAMKLVMAIVGFSRNMNASELLSRI